MRATVVASEKTIILDRAQFENLKKISFPRAEFYDGKRKFFILANWIFREE